MKNFRMIVIDPIEKVVFAKIFVSHGGLIDTLTIMQKEVGGLIEKAITIGNDNEKYDLFVNEEGLMILDHKHHFHFAGLDNPLIGKAVIVASNEEGDTLSCELELDNVIELVRFPE